MTEVWVQPAPANATIAPLPDTSQERLYCPATARYYPDVLECSRPWWRVTPGGGSSPQPSTAPEPEGSGPAWTPPASSPANSRVFESTASLSSTEAVLVDIDFPSIAVPTYDDRVAASADPRSASAQAARNSASSQAASRAVGGRKIPAPPMDLPR